LPSPGGGMPFQAIIEVSSPREGFEEDIMKVGIHPAYEQINVMCACGNHFKTGSTHKGDIRLEICSNCHPFFTGRQKLIDSEGRVDRFNKNAIKTKALQAAREAAVKKPAVN